MKLVCFRFNAFAKYIVFYSRNSARGGDITDVGLRRVFICSSDFLEMKRDCTILKNDQN